YYQAILEDNDSAFFKHFKEKEETTYSTCKILRGLAPSEWKHSISAPIRLSQKYAENSWAFIPYNYWDYQQAWFNSFFIQNKNEKHSWLLYFDTNTCKTDRWPLWWITWWDCFGSCPEILRQDVKESLEVFKTHYDPTPAERKFTLLSLFCAKFFVPWVLSWTVEADYQKILTVRRRFEVKWWDKYIPPKSVKDYE
ncbi:hypothetical protein PHJA_000832100, partial [Phtheirospermum japonicum]